MPLLQLDSAFWFKFLSNLAGTKFWLVTTLAMKHSLDRYTSICEKALQKAGTFMHSQNFFESLHAIFKSIKTGTFPFISLLQVVWISSIRGLAFSLEGRVPNLQKVGSMKLQPPHFSNKNCMTPHHWYTLPPEQAKIVLKSVFLNKINTLSVVILWLPTFWSSKFYHPLFFFPKNYDPPVLELTEVSRILMTYSFHLLQWCLSQSCCKRRQACRFSSEWSVARRNLFWYRSDGQIGL